MSRILIDQERCKGCALCTIACPGGLLKMDGKVNRQGFLPVHISAEDLEKCTSCALCGRMCPDLAIRVYRKTDEKKS